MKHIARIIAAIAVLGALSVDDYTPQPEPQGKGSCYEAQPICIGGRPVCVCTVALDCYWSCR